MKASAGKLLFVTALWVASMGCKVRAEPATPTTAARPAASHAEPASSSYQLAAVNEDVARGFGNATSVLATSPRREPSTAPAIFQRLPELASRSAPSIFIVEAATDRGELCTLEQRRVELCHKGVCRAFDGSASPLVLCNSELVSLLATLIAAQHASDRWLELTGSDASFISLLDRAEREPEPLMNALEPRYPAGHLAEHWTMLATLFIGRELALWETLSKEDSANPRWPRSDAAFCGAIRDYSEAEVSAPDVVSAQDVVGVLSGFSKMYGHDAARRLADELTSDILLVAMTLWYRRVAAFERADCSREVTGRFRLTRCLCTTPAAGWVPAARGLLADPSSSLVLRGSSIINQIWKGHEPPTRAVMSAVLLSSLRAGALKLGRVACARHGRLGAESVQVHADFPALEGVRDASVGADAILWPAPSERQELFEYCAARIPDKDNAR